MAVLHTHDVFLDEGQWLRHVLTGAQERTRILPPLAAVDRIRRRLLATIAVERAKSEAA